MDTLDSLGAQRNRTSGQEAATYGGNKTAGELNAANSSNGNPLPVSNKATANAAVPKITPSNDQTEIKAPAELDQALNKLNQQMQDSNRDLRFSFDSELGRAVVSVVDSSTEQLVRQIPSETALHLARNLNTYLDEVNTQENLNRLLQQSAKHVAANSPEQLGAEDVGLDSTLPAGGLLDTRI